MLWCGQALVFSQYSNTLDWLKQRLPEEGFGYRTITGSMPLKQRSKAIEVRLRATAVRWRAQWGGGRVT
jgi:superfamily II DNA/RNA helicase